MRFRDESVPPKPYYPLPTDGRMESCLNAVIMAGGEGTRLRPLTLGRPKPMTPLLGRPVMEHIINLLKRCGITDI